MNETTANDRDEVLAQAEGDDGPAAAPPPPGEPRRLYRRSDGRIAGVAGGLADYLRVDPVLIRLAFVVSIFVGGIGLVAYLVAWLVIPRDDEGRPGSPDRSNTASLTTVVGIVLLVIAVMIGVLNFDGPFDGGALIPLALIAGGIFLLTQRPGESLLATRESSAAAGSGEPEPPAPPSPPRPLDESDSGDSSLPPPPAPSIETPPSPYREPPPPNYVTAVTLSLLALVAAGGLAIGAADWFDITATDVLAVALLVVGGGLLASAVLGRARGLILIGILLTMVTLATATLEPTLGHGVGDRRYEPVTAADLEPVYELGIGDLVVDLRELDLPDGTHELRVELGIGRALVLVPPEVGLVVAGDVAIGELELFGRDQSGIDNDLRVTSDNEADSTLILDVEVGIGKGEVSRG